MRVIHTDHGCHAPRLRGHARAGFTLIELLITITIIGILAGISFGALNAARQTARTSKTKSTIAKLDRIIMRRYEEYATRRVPISTAGMRPDDAARARLDALRDLMRMEMPERWNDISVDPQTSIALPALARRYRQRYNPPDDPSGTNSAAECLYMIIATGSSEDREQFNESEIGDTDDDGWSEFIDGWGTPIRFLRWAPGFLGDSDLQSDDYENDHDPFDTHGVDGGAYHLMPLIYSYGPDKKPGINTELSHTFSLPDGPFANLAIGEPDGTGEHFDNIHNHRIEQK